MQIIPPDQPQYDQFGRPIPQPGVVSGFNPQHVLNATNATPAQPVIPPQASVLTDTQGPQMTPIPPSMRQQPQVMPQPSFAPLPPTTAQSAAQTGLPIPQRQDYQAHGLHRVLNAIAGGFAGAAGHPEVGNQLAQRPYENAVADWQRKIGQLKTAADIDTELQRQGVQKAVAQTGAEYKGITAEQNQQKIDTSKTVAASKQKHLEQLGKYTEWKMLPENQKKDDLQYLMSLPPEEQADALKMMTTMKQAGRETDEQKTQAAVDKANALAKNAITNPDIAKATAITAGTRANATEAAKKGPAPDQATVDYWTKQVLNDDSHWAQVKSLGKGIEEAVGNNLVAHNIDLTKLDSMTRDTAKLAQTALPHVNTILNELLPRMAKTNQLGPLMGRWNEFMTGTVGKGADFVALRDNIKLLQTNLGRIHGGARGGGSVQMLNHFKSMADAGRMDEPTLKGALGVFQDWLKGYAGMSQAGDKEFNEAQESSQGGFNWGSIKKAQ